MKKVCAISTIDMTMSSFVTTTRGCENYIGMFNV